MEITNFTHAREALSRFYGLQKEYSLDTIWAFMDFLGNPQDSLRIIHVAGTSGKTSTCYYIAGLLTAAGRTVGLTVSPHVDEINERLQVNLTPLPEAIFCSQLEEFLVLVDKSSLPLSYFEVMVAFAYWYFAKIKVDYAVIEVGLGGRLDGTNVVQRADKVCVITNIGLDHTQILGDTLPEIAAEKAGIITTHNHVFTHNHTDEVVSVFRRMSDQRHATLHVHEEKQDARLRALPLFQQHNFGLAEAVVGYVFSRDGGELSPAIIATAAHTYVPARMEIVQYHGRTLIIDGAHNGQKMQTLLASVRAKYPQASIAALVAFVDGDERRRNEALEVLLGNADEIVATEFTSRQDVPKKSVPAQYIADFATSRAFDGVLVRKNPKIALDRLLECQADILLVTGSFYLLNHIRPLIIKQ